ncbi:parasitic phase-specific protein PSP-1 [Moelleriella libera RCEF 2490]|uniref:Parasitic phase-specific protein PSP-1 n=1 Tax=Moelleriella libera RCEF 2490 TaxID=1081109 RepID=A0A168C3Y3_9HYPO|nr:parasitic phase-specific protein PSP-1 [Moelleriella libera RCEF 2490]
MADQGMFIGFEGVLVAVAVVVLVVFHPAVCARELFEGGGKRGLKREAEAEAEGTGTGTPSVEEKDV